MKYSIGCASRDVKCKLFRSKVLHCYGSETWDLSNRRVDDFGRACGQAARRLHGLPPQCPSSFMNTLFGMDLKNSVIYKKFISLINCFKSSINDKMKCIYYNAIDDARSVIRRNLCVIVEQWGSLTMPDITRDRSPEYHAMLELLDVREGSRSLELEVDDVDALIMLLCMR